MKQEWQTLMFIETGFQFMQVHSTVLTTFMYIWKCPYSKRFKIIEMKLIKLKTGQEKSHLFFI